VCNTCERVALTGEADHAELVVDDEGPGIERSFRDQAFEPFRKSPARNGRRAGYGLGLALARRAVEMHGGTIGIEDSPQGGARIRIRLPRQLPVGSPTSG